MNTYNNGLRESKVVYPIRVAVLGISTEEGLSDDYLIRRGARVGILGNWSQSCFEYFLTTEKTSDVPPKNMGGKHCWRLGELVPKAP